jgi:RNA polymerase sigma-70 factor, ECF subfamily
MSMPRALEKVRAAMAEDRIRVQLVRTAGRVLPGHESEDAAHDAVVQALAHADQFRDDAQVATWLHRIVINAALVRQRSAVRAARRLVRAQRETGAAPGMAVPSRQANVAREVEDGELRAQLRAAVSQLPEVYRTVVERCVYEEQAADRVARELGITSSALRTRIMRARERLRVMV